MANVVLSQVTPNLERIGLLAFAGVSVMMLLGDRTISWGTKVGSVGAVVLATTAIVVGRGSQ